MRVLMTGGYGCIGSWVARQLVDAGQEVWIYDLKEDTHRLDLILREEQMTAVHYVAGDVSDLDSLRSAVERVEATHILHLAGLQTPTCRAHPLLGAKVNVLGTLAVFETALCPQGPGAPGCLREFGGGTRPSRRRVDRTGRRPRPAGPFESLRGVQGV